MKSILVIGYFGYNTGQLDGQTVKTRDVYRLTIEQTHDAVDYQFVPGLWNKRTRIFKAAKYVRQYKPDVVISFLPSVNKTMSLAKLFFKAKLIVSERNNNTCITRGDKIQFNLYRLADAIVPNSNSQVNFIRKTSHS